MSTRGRANAIRAALEGRGVDGRPLRSAELEAAWATVFPARPAPANAPPTSISPCSRPSCSTPAISATGCPGANACISSVDLLGRLGCLMPALANAALRRPWLRAASKNSSAFPLASAPSRITPRNGLTIGSRKTRARRIPRAAASSCGTTHLCAITSRTSASRRWRCSKPPGLKSPAAGRRCCGRPAFSQGNLGRRRQAWAGTTCNSSPPAPIAPILFLEPSCYSMFAEDYRELDLPGTEQVAGAVFSSSNSSKTCSAREPEALRFKPRPATLPSTPIATPRR
jgi:hypothetical protein